MKNDALIGIFCFLPEVEDVWKFFEFPGIHFGDLCFHVDDHSVHSIKKNKHFVMKTEFTEEYFQEMIRWSFQAERLVLHGYPKGAKRREIDVYEDFLESECEIIILVCDSAYVEIYSKNRDWLYTMLETARAIPNARVEEKYLGSDPRDRMYV